MFLLFCYPYLQFLLSRLLQKHRKYHGFGWVCGLPFFAHMCGLARRLSQFLGMCLARARARRATTTNNNSNNNNNNQNPPKTSYCHPTRTHTLFPGTAGGCVSSWIIHKSGRRPRRPALALGGGLRLVTEGYMWRAAPAADPGGGDLGLTSGSPPPRQNPCNLQCILLLVFKNLVFYSVSWLSRFRNSILALSKNHAFYVVLRFKGRPGPEKMTCWRCLDLLRVNYPKFADTMGQPKAKIGWT